MSSNITFECQRCGMLFSSQEELELHLKQEHPERK